MRRDELARPVACRIAEARNRLALMRPDTDAWPDAWRLRVHRHARPAFADIGDRIAPARHAEPARAMHIVPLRVELALAVEHLHAVVLAIRHVHPAVRVTADVVNDVERAWLRARLTPGEL